MPKKGETAEEFIKRLMSMPNPDLTDPKTARDFGNRIAAASEKEIREQESLQKKSLGRAFTKVVGGGCCGKK